MAKKQTSRTGRKEKDLETLRRRASELESLSRRLEQTQAALKASQETIRALLDATPDRAMLLDTTGKVLAINEAAATSLGGPASRFIGKSALDLLPPELAGQRKKMFDEARKDLAAGKPVHHEDQRDGRWLASTLYPVHDKNGRIRQFALFSRDITKQKRTEEALRKSELLYRTTIDAMDDPIHVVEPDLRFTLFNRTFQKWCKQLGLETEAIGRHVFDFFPFLTDKVHQAYRRVLETGLTVNIEETVTVGDKEIITEVRKTPVMEGGKVARIITTVRDITERTRTRQALQQTKERLQSTIDNTWDIIFQIDLKGNFTFANKAAEMITGYPVRRLLHRNVRGLIAPEYQETASNRLKDRIAEKPLGQPFVLEIIRSDGRRVPLELTTTGVYRNGKLVASQGIARDVTERKRAEENLRAAHRKLMTIREDERKRLAIELHDSIGQSLVAMQLAIDNILAESRASKLEGLSSHLVRASEKCNSLIREVRGICHGLYPPTLESLGLYAALKQLAGDCRIHTKVNVKCPKKLMAVRLGDEVEIALFRIAQEALQNALRHGQGDEVKIHLRLDKADLLELSLCDNGTGFEPEDVAGDGLGLNAMTERAQAIGGTLNISSKPGRTCITVNVPVKGLSR
ncbi:MAG: PAS domain S-box protein [Planctomycetota bacterium]|nr:PAS domain S-box protein [Planctomycetota bacterium]